MISGGVLVVGYPPMVRGRDSVVGWSTDLAVMMSMTMSIRSSCGRCGIERRAIDGSAIKQNDLVGRGLKREREGGSS